MAHTSATATQPRTPAGTSNGGRWTTAAKAEANVNLGSAPAGSPCAARPGTQFRHYDGPCKCFCGGEAPEFVAAPAGAPCAARPGTEFRHFNGPCKCFCGGEAPEFVVADSREVAAYARYRFTR